MRTIQSFHSHSDDVIVKLNQAVKPPSATSRRDCNLCKGLDWNLTIPTPSSTLGLARSSVKWVRITSRPSLPADVLPEHCGWPRTDCFIFVALAIPKKILQEHRRLTYSEMARLQGFRNGDIAWKAARTPATTKGRQVGNAMSVPVLQEAIRSVLAAAKLLWFCHWLKLLSVEYLTTLRY